MGPVLEALMKAEEEKRRMGLGGGLGFAPGTDAGFSSSQTQPLVGWPKPTQQPSIDTTAQMFAQTPKDDPRDMGAIMKEDIQSRVPPSAPAVAPSPQPPAAPAVPAAPPPVRQGGGDINIGEGEFQTGGNTMQVSQSPAMSPAYNWMDTALDGALGKAEPERYDYAAPQHNVPDSAGYGADRQYYRTSPDGKEQWDLNEIVIEDAGGPAYKHKWDPLNMTPEQRAENEQTRLLRQNVAGTNRTVVQATQRPDYERKQGDYDLGRSFREQPRAVAQLVESLMSGRGRTQQAQQPRQPPAQVLEAIAAAQKNKALAEQGRNTAVAGAKDAWMPWSPDAKDQIALANSTYDKKMAPIDAELEAYQKAYPGLFGSSGGAAAREMDPESVRSQITNSLPNVDQAMVNRFLEFLATQSG